MSNVFPTYEEWADGIAAELLNRHPEIMLIVGILDYVKYAGIREQLIIRTLVAKGVLDKDEVGEFFGDEAHEKAESDGLATIIKHLMRTATSGQLKMPDGRLARPDDVIHIVNTIADIPKNGVSGKALEVILSFVRPDRNLREEYEKSKEAFDAESARREKGQSRFDALLEKKQREYREHRVKILVSRCRVADRPIPSDEDQQRMIDGEIPIPEKL